MKRLTALVSNAITFRAVFGMANIDLFSFMIWIFMRQLNKNYFDSSHTHTHTQTRPSNGFHITNTVKSIKNKNNWMMHIILIYSDCGTIDSLLWSKIVCNMLDVQPFNFTISKRIIKKCRGCAIIRWQIHREWRCMRVECPGRNVQLARIGASRICVSRVWCRRCSRCSLRTRCGPIECMEKRQTKTCTNGSRLKMTTENNLAIKSPRMNWTRYKSLVLRFYEIHSNSTWTSWNSYLDEC